MNIKYDVIPTEYIQPIKIIYKIEIQILNLNLFQSVSIVVSLYDENDFIIDNKIINITGNDYLSWGNNDEWLIEYVFTYLNLEKKDF